MNHQTQGPYRNEGVELIDVGDVPSVPHAVIRSEGERWVALVELTDEECAANARLVPAALNAFDKAGRALGVDAAELAERIDLAALLSNLRALLAADKDGNPILFRALDTAHKDGAADALIDLHEQMKRLEAVTA